MVMKGIIRNLLTKQIGEKPERKIQVQTKEVNPTDMEQ
jgi:hypothetical protein